MSTKNQINKGVFIILLLLLGNFGLLFGQGKLLHLLTEYQTNPIGLDVEKPRFSWQMANLPNQFGQKQTAYQIIVTDEQNQIVWDSQKKESDISLGIVYEGAALKPTTKYNWVLKVWNEKGQELKANANFETGLKNPGLEAWAGGTWI